jgi:diguanylate cyclase (GGDEF)-like protein/PAS domain S-box-containing protein
MATPLDPDDAMRLSLVDVLPVAVFVIDSDARIVFANERTAAMIGIAGDDLIGREALDFVLDEDVEYAASLLVASSQFHGDIMGPSRIRYLDADGVAHWTQVWAYEAPPTLGVDGFIVALTSESTRDVLASAIGSVASDGNLDDTLAAIAESMRGEPIGGVGTVLVVQSAAEDQEFRAVGTWPLDEDFLEVEESPWRDALITGEGVDIDNIASSDLAEPIREALLDHGCRALWVRPVVSSTTGILALLVIFSPRPGPISPNQERNIEDALRIAGIAFAQTRRRAELEHAAKRDPITGVRNRVSFNERLERDRRSADVLFVDLDHFKSVNDNYGHECGDLVLALAARRIVDSLRRHDTVYRTGGDEFIVLCESSGEDPVERTALADRIIDALDVPFQVDDESITIGATIGIAAGHHRSLTEAVRAADEALLKAKSLGRARWRHAAS